MPTTIEIRDSVLAHQFNSSRYGEFIIRKINEGQQKLCRDVKQRKFLEEYDFATVADDNSYTLPTDFSSFVGLYDQTNDDILRELSEREFEDTAISRGTPLLFTIIESTIYLTPTPDSAINLRLRYYRKPLAIPSDGSIDPEIDEDYHDLLEHYAIWRCYVAEHDYEAGDYHKLQWLEGKDKMKNDLHADITSRPKQVPHMWENIAR